MEGMLLRCEASLQGVAAHLSASGCKLEVTGLFELLVSFAADLDRAHEDNAEKDAKVGGRGWEGRKGKGIVCL